MRDPADAARPVKHFRSYTILEANQLTGRVLAVGGHPYTVTSAGTDGEVHVWDPITQTLIRFDSRETFEHWAYGTPVPSAGDVR
jgi:hypothetical protein